MSIYGYLIIYKFTLSIWLDSQKYYQTIRTLHQWWELKCWVDCEAKLTAN